MATSTVARRARPSRPDHRAEAEAWAEGARRQFAELLDLARTTTPDAEGERAVMRGLAAVGAALLQSMASRRQAKRRPPRGRRSA